MNAAGERTVEDLKVGDVLDLADVGLPGCVLVLVTVTRPRWPGVPYHLTYEVLSWPDHVDRELLEAD